MDLSDIRDQLLSLPETSEGTPFGPEVLVYKVAGKMFATLSPENVPPAMNLKCDPDRALDLRDEHEGILPGYHMNKKHWNTLILDDGLPVALVQELIQHSWDRVVAGMSAKDRQRLQEALADEN